MNRRTVIAGAILAGAGISACSSSKQALAVDPLGSAVNVPVDERTGKTSIVYFTRDLSPNGLRKIYAKINAELTGRVAVKLHTGEQNGPNIIPAAWVKELIKDIPGATIVETNTYYEGDRYTTRQHRKTLKVNGWDFCPVDIMDSKGTVKLPVKGGRHFKEMARAFSTTTPCSCSRTSRDIRWGALAAPTRTSASAAPTDGSARR